MIDIPITGSLQDIINGFFGALATGVVMFFSIFFGGFFSFLGVDDLDEHIHNHHD